MVIRVIPRLYQCISSLVSTRSQFLKIALVNIDHMKLRLILSEINNASGANANDCEYHSASADLPGCSATYEKGRVPTYRCDSHYQIPCMLQTEDLVHKGKRKLSELSDETPLFPRNNESLLCTENINEIYPTTFAALHDESAHNVSGLLLHCDSANNVPLLSQGRSPNEG